MNNLIINSVSIISPDSKKAKYQEFKKGINIVVGDMDTGNYIGKSSLLRSIFHTMGADGKFDKDDWEKEGAYIYLLNFTINDQTYTMLRKQELFKLFDNNKKEIFKVINRDDLAKKLYEYFFDEVYLLTHQQTYSLAHPVYNYLLNYLEQTEIHLCEFRNFNNLTAFHGSYYSDLLYSLLGVSSKEYSSAVTTQKVKQQELKLKQETEKSLEEMLNIIKSKSDKSLSVDELQTLKDSLSRYEEQYSDLTSNANSIKVKLYEAYSAKSELQNIMNEIINSISDSERIGEKIAKDHTCPICHSQISEARTYFENSNETQNYSYQLLDIEKDIANIEREINILTEKYDKYINEIKSIENRVFENKHEINDKLELIGIRKIRSNVNNEITNTRVEIQTLENELSEISKGITALKKLRSEVDKYYIECLNDFSLNYDLRIPALDKISKVDQKFRVSGNHVMITTVAWLCSLLKTKYKFNSNSVVLPLVYDNPNNANFDISNDYMIFKLLFDNLPQNGQIITSCVGFDNKKYEENYDLNIIQLDNNRYELLNKDDYDTCLRKLNELK